MGIVEVASLTAGTMGPAAINHVDVQTNQLGGQRGKLRGPAVTSASFRHEIPAMRVPLLAQSSQKA